MHLGSHATEHLGTTFLIWNVNRLSHMYEDVSSKCKNEVLICKEKV